MAARTKKLIVAAALYLAGTLSICGASLYGSPAEPQGSAPQAVKRVVSLSPALTEMLFAVGAGPQVVGVSSYDDFPPKSKTLPRVGALLDPDVERILSLRPDLVITYGSQVELERQLGRAGIRVFSHRNGGIEHALQTLRDIGRVTGHAAEGERQAKNIEERLDAVRAKVRGLPRPRTLLVFNRQPWTLQQMYATGGKGFLNDMLDIAGGVNVFADIEGESVQPSHEVLLVRAPQVIVELRATGLFAAADEQKEKAAWSTLPSIPAVRSGRIHILNGDYLVVPGPRIAAAAETLARALHPEVFR